jgi:hypothetical protein
MSSLDMLGFHIKRHDGSAELRVLRSIEINTDPRRDLRPKAIPPVTGGTSRFSMKPCPRDGDGLIDASTSLTRYLGGHMHQGSRSISIRALQDF